MQAEHKADSLPQCITSDLSIPVHTRIFIPFWNLFTSGILVSCGPTHCPIVCCFPNSRALPPAVWPSAFLLQTGLNSLGSTQSGSHSRGPSSVPSFCIGYFSHCDQILKKQCMEGRICSDSQSEGVNPRKGVQTRVALPVLVVDTLYSARAREMGVATHWILRVPAPFVCSRNPGSCLPHKGGSCFFS